MTRSVPPVRRAERSPLCSRHQAPRPKWPLQGACATAPARLLRACRQAFPATPPRLRREALTLPARDPTWTMPTRRMALVRQQVQGPPGKLVRLRPEARAVVRRARKETAWAKVFVPTKQTQLQKSRELPAPPLQQPPFAERLRQKVQLPRPSHLAMLRARQRARLRLRREAYLRRRPQLRRLVLLRAVPAAPPRAGPQGAPPKQQDPRPVAPRALPARHRPQRQELPHLLRPVNASHLPRSAARHAHF